MDHESADAGVRIPKPVLGPGFALGPQHVVVCVVCGAMLIYLNVLSLFYTDLWSHVAYGRWILAHRALPVTEPFLPLAAGQRVIPYCWLSQVIFALVERWGGAAALSDLFAVAVLARYLVLARVGYLQTGRLGLALAGMLSAFVMSWVRNPILRPEVFAALCFHLLLWILVVADPGARQRPGDGQALDPTRAVRWDWRVWVGTPVVFAAWVNLHATVLVGLIVLGAHLLGRAVEVCWSTWRIEPGRLRRDPALRRWALLTALAAAATLVNPSGWGWVEFSWTMAHHPNLRAVNEWLPFPSTSLPGRTFAASWGVLAVVLRLSRRPVRPVEVLLLAIFSVGVLQSARMLLWYVPIYVYAVLPHVAEIAGHVWPARPRVAPTAPDDPEALPPHRSYRYTLACLAIVWASFALSHLSDRVLGADPRPAERLYHRSTPRGLADHLIAHPPIGQVWNSQALGDWLIWAWLTEAGPDAPPLQLFVDTHMHLVPRQVWVDYQTIGSLGPGWRDLLDRYRVNTLVISKLQHRPLAREIRQVPGWTVRYEDDNGLIVTRDRPLDPPAASRDQREEVRSPR